MKDSNHSKRGLHRRKLIKGTAIASLGLVLGAFGIPETFGQTSVRSAE